MKRLSANGEALFLPVCSRLSTESPFYRTNIGVCSEPIK